MLNYKVYILENTFNLLLSLDIEFLAFLESEMHYLSLVNWRRFTFQSYDPLRSVFSQQPISR